MNRLVSYSESSEDDERGFSSPEKCDCPTSSGDYLCNNIKNINCAGGENAVFQYQNQVSIKNQTRVHHCDTNVNISENLQSSNVANIGLCLCSDSDNGNEGNNVSATKTHKTVPTLCFSFETSSNDTNDSNEQNVCNINESDRFPLFKHSCDKIIDSTSLSDSSLVSNFNTSETLVSDAKEDVGLLHAKQSEKSNVVSRSVPRNLSENVNTSRKRKHPINNISNSKSELHLPDSLKTMFHEHCHKWIDDPAEHDNRIRSFPHLAGNWAAHVFFPVQQNNIFEEFVLSLLKIFEPVVFKAFPEYHISLSRTVAIRHHWIEPIVTSLREQLKPLKSNMSEMTAIKLFTNDEKTRTFICIELSQDDTEFSQYINAVDKCFLEFKLPVYYENPSFHISIGWCLGDVTTGVSDEKLVLAKVMLSNFMAENPELSVVLLQQVCCRAGNKLFAITLEDERH